MLGLIALVACSEVTTSPRASSPSLMSDGGVQPDMTWEGCLLTPGCSDGGGTSPISLLHDGNPSADLLEPTLPADPSPGAAGIWLAMHPSDCYKTYSTNWAVHIDRDIDGLDDYCELRLATAFAPMLAFAGEEHCAEGEPYWIAKFIDNQSPFNFGDMVRLTYLEAYYDDCGELGHDGDSELIQLTVVYDGASHHWKLVNSWLSAHAVIGNIGNQLLGPLGSNSSTWGPEFEFPSGRAQSFPRVWISKDKHANYRSLYACNTGGVLIGAFETCEGSPGDAGRFRVWKNHNIGSAAHKLVDCVASPLNPDGPQECFWTGTYFAGWRDPAREREKAVPYWPFLSSIVSGCFMYASGAQWCSSWGI